MKAKSEKITALGARTQQIASDALGLNSDDCNQLYRSVMNPHQLMLWDLAIYWEQECLRCVAANAHFSAMVSAVAMNEALLCYLCLVNEPEVRASPLFNRVAGGRNATTLYKLVGQWKLKTLLQFAFDLEWVPNDIVDAQKAGLLIAAVAEMQNDPLPSDFTFASKDLPELLANEPGKGMLELTQNLRNYVHPTRWLRLQEKLKTQSFTLWCEIATKVSAELRDALLLTAFRSQSRKVADARAGLSKVLSGSDSDRDLYISLLSERLKQQTGLGIKHDLDVRALIDGLHEAFLTAEENSPDGQ